jgi:hypothetical protein
MTTRNPSDNNIKTFPSPIIDEYSLRNNDLNNNEIYEKLRPLERMTNILNDDQAHGDDTHVEVSKDYEKSLELHSSKNRIGI